LGKALGSQFCVVRFSKHTINDIDDKIIEADDQSIPRLINFTA